MTIEKMDSIPTLQLPLFTYGESVSDFNELIPVIWLATEAIASHDPTTRHHGIDQLLELGAQRVSPLVAYMFATRIVDPDINIRRRVIYTIADLISPEREAKPVSERIRKDVTNYLHDMQEEMVFALLEVAVIDQFAEKAIFQIFNTCPTAGKYLGDILSQWSNPILIRQKAIHFIGLVGYMEALPVLEKMMNRLDARQNGQGVMPFASSSAKSDEDILPYLKAAIKQLSPR